jgi:hypothetical protein
MVRQLQGIRARVTPPLTFCTRLLAMQKVESSNLFSRFPKSRFRAGFRRFGVRPPIVK